MCAAFVIVSAALLLFPKVCWFLLYTEWFYLIHQHYSGLPCWCNKLCLGVLNFLFLILISICLVVLVIGLIGGEDYVLAFTAGESGGGGRACSDVGYIERERLPVKKNDGEKRCTSPVFFLRISPKNDELIICISRFFCI